MSFKPFCYSVVFCAILCCASLISVGAIYEKAGFYAGLSVGAGYNAGNFKGSAVLNDTGETINTRDKISICGFEKDFGGFVGYVTHLSREDWLAGMEFGIEKPFYKKHFKTTLWDDNDLLTAEGCNYRIKTKYAVKLHAKIGKILDENWFVYGLAGIAMKRARISMSQEDLGEICMRKFLLGFAVGLGIEREINENWRLGLELVNTYYPSKTLKTSDEDNEFEHSSRIRLNSTQVALRLVYNRPPAKVRNS